MYALWNIRWIAWSIAIWKIITQRYRTDSNAEIEVQILQYSIFPRFVSTGQLLCKMNADWSCSVMPLHNTEHTFSTTMWSSKNRKTNITMHRPSFAYWCDYLNESKSKRKFTYWKSVCLWFGTLSANWMSTTGLKSYLFASPQSDKIDWTVSVSTSVWLVPFCSRSKIMWSQNSGIDAR